MKNYHSGGGDPAERIQAHEEYLERRRAREAVSISVEEGGLYIRIKLPLERLLELSEKLEACDTLKDRLRVIWEAM